MEFQLTGLLQKTTHIVCEKSYEDMQRVLRFQNIYTPMVFACNEA